MQLPQLVPPQPGCTLCDLHSGPRNPGIPTIHLATSLPSDPGNPALVVVGMNPGYQEDRLNEPFVGPAGKLLRGPMLMPLLQQATIYLANTARCCTPLAAQPKSSHYKRCLPFLLADLQAIATHHHSPVSNAILCVGAHAISHLSRTGMPKAMSLQSAFSRQGQPLHGFTLFTTYHPAAILRTPNLIHPTADHIALLSRHLTGTIPTVSSPQVVPPRAPTHHA